MTKHTNPTPVSDEQVRTLLERYNCPVPFHEVRTRFLGNIATPVMSASPIKMVEKLWDGELPAFDSIDAANELIGALVMGLWNRLTRHQDRNSPFRLMRIDSAPTREGLAALAPIVVSIYLASCVRYSRRCLRSPLTRPRLRTTRAWRRRSGTCVR
jgi:hypothetical protein